MTAAIIIALIALAGSVFSTVATVFGAPILQARREAQGILETYRGPLLAASYELQARLHNILRREFIEKYILEDTASRRDSAMETTLFVFAQFFGLREVIRREVQYLRFTRDWQTRETGRLLRDIGETFLSDQYGTQLMIWRVEQRGLGEQMIESSHEKLTCVGYAAFVERRTTMSKWLGPLEHDLAELDDGGRQRLVQLQHLLLVVRL